MISCDQGPAINPEKPDQEKELRLKAEKNLKNWNIAMGLLHLGQAVAVLIAGLTVGNLKTFKIPLNTCFTDWSRGYPMAAIQKQADMPFVAVTSGFAWMSAAAHFIVILCFDKYLADLRKGRNVFRWYEYAFSSSLMMGLIAQLFGMYDVISLVLLMSVNACMNLFGLVHEVQNPPDREKTDWTSFWFGCFAGAVPWACTFAYLGGARSAEVPAFVWAVLFVYLFMFNTFPINMVLQYKKIGRWSDEKAGFQGGGYLYGEKVYQILSLVAKSLLLWLVVGGSNQPSSFTGVVAPTPATG